MMAETFKDELICSICIDLFTNPVMLACGHNFCNPCISDYWKNQKKNVSCPECRSVFARKSFRKNRVLANLVEKTQEIEVLQMQEKNKLCCKKHEEKFKLFCETDQKLICLICRDCWEHKNHSFLPVTEVVETYKRHSISLMEHIRSEFAELHLFLTETENKLISELKQKEEQVLRPMEKSLMEIENKMSSIQQEIVRLQLRLEKPNDIEFLKDIHETDDSYRTDLGYEEPRLVSSGLSMGINEGFLQFSVWKQMLKIVNPVPAPLNLNQYNAEARIILPQNHRNRRHAESQGPSVIIDWLYKTFFCPSMEGFTSGKHYWEVEVGSKTAWKLGISVYPEEEIAPEMPFWTKLKTFVNILMCRKIILVFQDNWLYEIQASTCTVVFPKEKPRKMGIYLDYEAGQVLFYNADDMSHICTVTDTFPGTVYPYFHSCQSLDGQNSEPLKIYHY
ncbi:zinc-binding protein A33-like isoform X2 [Latimeria chalumnae]|uniref:zinc-binding protein A33-like isoform X2 n=1 Tax=Latimeria chalumnae TaxID=7897 RepID=UPI00313C5A42